MSASIEQLRDDLRLTAAKKRTQVFESFAKQANPLEVLAELSSVLAELRDVLKEMKANGADGNGSLNFVVTERDGDGKPKSFKVES